MTDDQREKARLRKARQRARAKAGHTATVTMTLTRHERDALVSGAEARGYADITEYLLDLGYRDRIAQAAPIRMVLHCPWCGRQHLDEPGTAAHCSHTCHQCLTVWRPADVPTVGVLRVDTFGEHDNWQPYYPVSG